jgi:hypothetical protein
MTAALIFLASEDGGFIHSLREASSATNNGKPEKTAGASCDELPLPLTANGTNNTSLFILP